MSKRAVILHGTDGSPDHNWFPWLKRKLEAEGYQTWSPTLPNNHTPSRKTYNDFLLNDGWDFTDNLVVGHSSGAVSVLNLLMDERCPDIDLGIMLGAWANGVPKGYEQSNKQFVNLFPSSEFNFELIKSKAKNLAFMHGDNDPFCPLEQAQYLAKELDAPITIIPDGHHLGSKYTELPELWEIIKTYI